MDCLNTSSVARSDMNHTYNVEYKQLYHTVENIIDKYVTHYICLFGIIGNIFNLLVLTRKSLTAHMEHMEKASNVGLIALAVSDLMYCLCSFPEAWVNETFFRPNINFWLVYDVYGNALINCFLVSSSWLTVAMAVSRYLAICHPLSGPQYIGVTSSRVTVSAVFCLSFLFNLPRFWMKKIHSITCYDGSKLYFPYPGYMKNNQSAKITYTVFYFLFGILVPLLILIYCTRYLLAALRNSRRLRRQHSTSTSNEATHVVTKTLCAIVILYIVLVGPAELVTFGKLQLASKNGIYKYGVAVKICNTLQMLNFAFNFILYCIINVHFRKIVRDFVLCRINRRETSPLSGQQYQGAPKGEEHIAME